MKPICLSILFLFCFNSTTVYAQNSIQQELDSIRNRTYKELELLYHMRDSVSAQLGKTSDTINKKKLEVELNNIYKSVEQSFEIKALSELDFVLRNPTSPIALDVLDYQLKRPEGLKHFNTIDSLYRLLAVAIQKSEKGRQVHQALYNYKNSVVGKKAPLFTAKDINGSSLSLNEFRSKKYVLIDFWASWCVPCKEEFPFLKQMYNAYKTKGLEIIGVSTDQNLTLWRNAVQKDSIGMWRHIVDKEGSTSIASLYSVIPIPLKVLVDKKGNIIGRWLGNEAENKKELQDMLETVFNKQD